MTVFPGRVTVLVLVTVRTTVRTGAGRVANMITATETAIIQQARQARRIHFMVFSVAAG
jgi:hypothetical protein